MLRRAGLRALGWGLLGTAGLRGLDTGARAQDSEHDALIQRFVGGVASLSARVVLQMPPVFGNGYIVPMTLSVESAMTEAEHVRRVHVLAPRNPIVPVATFHFSPQSGRAVVATRIRLSEPQHVIAVAEMSDGTLLRAQTWVAVETNGCG